MASSLATSTLLVMHAYVSCKVAACGCAGCLVNDLTASTGAPFKTGVVDLPFYEDNFPVDGSNVS